MTRIQVDVARQQVDGIEDEFAKHGITIKDVELKDKDGNVQGVSFMYRADRILVSNDQRERVQGILGRFGIGIVEVTPVIADIVRLDLRLPSAETPHPVLRALDEIDIELGEGIATPDHVLTVCDGIVSPCPATEPRPVDFDIEPFPGVRTDNSGDGVLIYIADTGLLQGANTAFSWLRGVRPAEHDGWDPRPPYPDPEPPHEMIIPPYSGHGTFVAGVARCMAPRADVIVSNVCDIAGSATESDFVMDLKRALNLGVDIFHLAVAAPTRKGILLHGIERWLALLRQYKGIVCVSPAGNSGVRFPTWPSVFPQVVSVGALTADGRDRAYFSNFGGWVDVYAPGRDIINAYTTGTYVYHDAPYTGQREKFYGMARWSGTSFSTPLVTGLIAARMSRTGENGQQAAAALLRQARANAIPGVGPILLPSTGEAPAPACWCRSAHDCESPAPCCAP